jgi:hypothetical protein
MLVGALFTSLRPRIMPGGNLAHITTLPAANQTRTSAGAAGPRLKVPATVSIAVQDDRLLTAEPRFLSGTLYPAWPYNPALAVAVRSCIPGRGRRKEPRPGKVSCRALAQDCRAGITIADATSRAAALGPGQECPAAPAAARSPVQGCPVRVRQLRQHVRQD